MDPQEGDPAKLEEQIGELLKASRHLQRIVSVDTTQVRLLLSRLLAQVQRSFYEASGGEGG